MQGEGDVFGFFVPHFHNGNAIRSPMLKCFCFVCEYLTTFRSANVSLESSIPGVFGDIFTFKINVGVCEKLARK